MGTVEYSEVLSGKVSVGDMWDLHSGAAEDSYLLGGGPVLLYVKFTLEQATKAQRGSRRVAPPLL